MKLLFHTFFILLILNSLIFANEYFTSKDTVFATRSDFPIVIDGILNEPVWRSAKGVSEFTQRDPIEGAKPSFETVVYVAYDDLALYIGARMYDSAPDSIIAKLGRKDVWMNSDFFAFAVDAYLDRRSGFFFGINAAGTFYDGTMMNDDWNDDSWDGVWDAKVNLDELGWTAEFRIPFSQLRFHKQDSYVWGINFRHDIQRYNEENYLVFTPKDGSGFVSRFPVLVGIEGIDAARNFELLPYARLKAEYIQTDAGDPFNDGSRYQPGFGADMKLGIGNNLTLDGTINPDFGQVEVDPAVINLSDVETFFPEKRPFFIEGASIFNFGRGGSRSNWGFNWGDPNFFYSRRIGQAPRGTDDLPDYDFIDIPDGTSILGAGKLSGKITDWNVGAVAALTNREYANLDSAGRRSETEVEPLTGWGILRAQKEIDQGFQGIGLMATVVNRRFKDERMRDQFNSESFSFGLDGWTFLDADKEWVMTAWGGISHVNGNNTRMINLQENSQHYFQRPDACHVSVDSNATSLTGYAARILLNKQKGNLFFNTAAGFIKPEFDVNDAGFFWRSDVINWHVAGGYRWTEPGKIFRRANLTFASFQSYDFDKNLTDFGFFHFGAFQFLNYYSFKWDFGYFPETFDNRKTRGGPLMIKPTSWFMELKVFSDERKEWAFGFSWFRWSALAGDLENRVQFEFEWKPITNLAFSFLPGYQWNYNTAQYVDQIDDGLAVKTFGKRYIFAELDQKTLSIDIRLNWTFTPRLSLQMYIQPLFAFGAYDKYKELARPKSFDFNEYPKENIEYDEENDEIIIYPDGPGGPAEPFVLSNPDFNFRSLRGNTVLRWEYIPGSTFYLVWTQSRSHSLENSDYYIDRSIVNIWNTEPDNIYMLKWTYWLNL